MSWLGTLAQPVLVILEDLQWADAASLELLRRAPLMLRERPVLVLVTCRSEEVHESHPLWTLLPQLQRTGAGVGSDPEENPLAVDSARLANMPLPETLQQAIDLGLARLSPGTEHMLQTAAVIGELFSYDALAAAVDLSEDALAAALSEALALRVIRTTTEEGERFAFDHALVREALATRLLAPRRRGELLLKLGFTLERAEPRQATALWEEATQLALAGELHDCLQIIAAHRLLGELAAEQQTEDLTESLPRDGAAQADEHFGAALRLAERCQFPYEAALTALARARALPSAPGARAGLIAARETLARLGAAPALAAAKAALAATAKAGAGPDGLTP